MSLDYSDWLTKGRLEVEIVSCKQARFHVAYAYDITEALKGLNIKVPNILEFGCGSSLIPAELDFKFNYTGVDKFPLCITKAELLNPDLDYVEGDVRDHQSEMYDVACAFAFLKHFSVDELPFVMSKLFKHGRTCIFSIPIGDSIQDDFSNGFPHTFVTRNYVEKIVKSYGHEIVKVNESIGPVELVFTTRKLNTKRPTKVNVPKQKLTPKSRKAKKGKKGKK